MLPLPALPYDWLPLSCHLPAVLLDGVLLPCMMCPICMYGCGACEGTFQTDSTQAVTEDEVKLLPLQVAYHIFCLLCRLLQRWRSGGSGSRRQPSIQLRTPKCWRDCWQMTHFYIASLSYPLGLTNCPEIALLAILKICFSECKSGLVSLIMPLHTTGLLLSPL